MYLLLSGLLLMLSLALPATAQDTDTVDEKTPDPYGIWSTMRRLDEIAAEPPGLRWPRNVPPPADTGTGEALRTPLFQAADPNARARAIESLDGNNDTRTLDRALDALADPDTRVRVAALRVLRDAVPKTLTIAVADRLAQGEDWQRESLYAALPELRAPLSVPMLAFFEDTRETSLYRQAAALALGRLGADGAGDALSKESWSEDMPLAEAAVEAMFCLHQPERAAEWSDLLLHPSQQVRMTAMQALGEQGDALALQNLGMVARGEVGLESAMQLLAVDAVAQWPLRESAPVLIEAMKRNLTVRRRVRDHLRFRTGLDLSDAPSEWEFALYGPPRDDTAQARGPVTEDAPSELLQEVNFVPPPMRGGVQVEYLDE